MEVNQTTSTKRDRLTHKWLEEETMKMLDFVQNNGDFEKPTSRLYYNKMSALTGVDVTWQLAKCKMRYLKQKYLSANEFLISSTTGIMNENQLRMIRGKVLKFCPFYDQLSIIFAENEQIKDSDAVEEEAFMPEELSEALIDFPSPDRSFSPSSIVAPFQALSAVPTMKISKRANSRNVVNGPTRRDVFRANKIELDERKFDFEMEIQTKRLKLEEQKLKNEYELKKMDLIKTERLAKYELDLKYKRD